MRVSLNGPENRALGRGARAFGMIALTLGSFGAAAARADLSGPTIVGHVNAQRAAQGIPAGIVHDETLSDGCAKHNAYGRLNNVLVHEEDPALAGFTPEGHQAALTSVLYRGSNAWTATRNPFETAPIHLHGLLAARLDRMGASEDQGYGCATTLASRNRPAPPSDRTYTYPGNGATGWVRSQLASESPYTPGEKAAPPIPAGTTTGPYLYVMFDGPTLTAFDIATATGATLTGPQGAVVPVARVGNTTPDLEDYLPTGMQVIPREPLLPGTTYTASVAASVTTQGGGGPARSFSHTWSFTTEELPDTSITSGPSGAVASSTASFAFASTKPGSSFECKLDAGGWVFCSTPKSLTALSEGPHTWSVRARDQSGNIDPSPATRSWTVDTTPPDTSIVAGPSGTVASASASISFSSTEAGSSECRLDAGAWVACASPRALSGLSDGSHTWSVRATDVAGNADPSPATRTWTVDTTPPDTSITAGPAGTVASASASFSFSSTESGSSECRLDAGAWVACASPRALSGLSDGSHTWSVRATDVAGNVDPSPATRTWAVDATAPDTSIVAGPSGTVATGAASFSFSATEAGTLECRLDTGEWAACASPRALSGLSDGSHTFSVRGGDAAGNVDPSPATRSWTIDTTAPQTTIDSGPSGSVQQTGATFTMSSSEAGSSLECRLDAGVWAACASPRTLSGLADGEHTFAVRATDAIGNAASTPTTRSWTVDTVAPLSPTPTDTDPDSPANDGAPRVKGTAAAGSTVRLHTDVFCSSVAAATGSAADFASPGLVVSVANGSSQTFWATATDQAGNRSACSSSSITYSEVAVTPPPPPRPPPPPPPPPVDYTAPDARLSGSTSQRLGKAVRVSVFCPAEACLATARGTVRVPKIGFGEIEALHAHEGRARHREGREGNALAEALILGACGHRPGAAPASPDHRKTQSHRRRCKRERKDPQPTGEAPAVIGA